MDLIKVVNRLMKQSYHIEHGDMTEEENRIRMLAAFLAAEGMKIQKVNLINGASGGGFMNTVYDAAKNGSSLPAYNNLLLIAADRPEGIFHVIGIHSPSRTPVEMTLFRTVDGEDNETGKYKLRIAFSNSTAKETMREIADAIYKSYDALELNGES